MSHRGSNGGFSRSRRKCEAHAHVQVSGQATHAEPPLMRALSCRAQERSIRSTPIERLLLSCRLHPASPRACRRGSLLLHRRSCSKPQHSCRHRVRSLAAIAALAGSRLARGSLSAGRLLLCSQLPPASRPSRQAARVLPLLQSHRLAAWRLQPAAQLHRTLPHRIIIFPW